MELSDLQHRPTCDPRERTNRTCPCGAVDAWISEAIDRMEQARAEWLAAKS